MTSADVLAAHFMPAVDSKAERFVASKGYIICNNIEGPLSEAWAAMEAQSKDFANKEKYRFYDSEKYKPLIRNGLPFGRRRALWRRLCDPCLDRVRSISVEDVWRRTFRWPTLDMEALIGSGARSFGEGGHPGNTGSSPPKTTTFEPQYPPYFGLDPALEAVLPRAFFLTEKGVRTLKFLLCLLAESNPDIIVAPMLPGFLCGMLTLLSPVEAFHAANGLLHLSREKYRVETRILYFKSGQLEHESMVRSMVHFIRGKAPEHVLKFESLHVDIFAIVNRLFCTFFTDVLPLCIALRVYDVFVNEGHKVLYRVGLALFVDILGASIRSAPSADVLQRLFTNQAELLNPRDLARLFEKAFDYSLAREVMQDVETRHSDPDRPLLQLRQYERRIEVRHRPEVFPMDGGAVLNGPQQWEKLFGYFADPNPCNAGFVPGRIERIFNTTFNGWSLSTMYRVMEDILHPFGLEHRVRGLLLIRGFVSDGEKTPVAGVAPAAAPIVEIRDGDLVFLRPASAPTKVLGCESRGELSGTRLILWDEDGHPNQHWRIIARGPGAWSLAPCHAAGLRLDSNNGVGAECHLWDTADETNPNQIWRLTRLPDGCWWVQRAMDGAALKPASLESGAAVRTANDSGADTADTNQEWRLELVNVAAPKPPSSGEQPIAPRASQFVNGTISTTIGAVLHPMPAGSRIAGDPADGPTAPQRRRYHGERGTFVFQMFDDDTDKVYFPALKRRLSLDTAAATVPQQSVSNTDAIPVAERSARKDRMDTEEEGPLLRQSTTGADRDEGPTKSVSPPPGPNSERPRSASVGLPPVVNNYFILAEPEYLTIGGGSVGGPAIRLRSDLQSASSYDCETFQSPSFTAAAIDNDGRRMIVAQAALTLEVTQVELYAIVE